MNCACFQRNIMFFSVGCCFFVVSQGQRNIMLFCRVLLCLFFVVFLGHQRHNACYIDYSRFNWSRLVVLVYSIYATDKDIFFQRNIMLLCWVLLFVVSLGQRNIMMFCWVLLCFVVCRRPGQSKTQFLLHWFFKVQMIQTCCSGLFDLCHRQRHLMNFAFFQRNIMLSCWVLPFRRLLEPKKHNDFLLGFAMFCCLSFSWATKDPMFVTWIFQGSNDPDLLFWFIRSMPPTKTCDEVCWFSNNT